MTGKKARLLATYATALKSTFPSPYFWATMKEGRKEGRKEARENDQGNSKRVKEIDQKERRSLSSSGCCIHFLMTKETASSTVWVGQGFMSLSLSSSLLRSLSWAWTCMVTAMVMGSEELRALYAQHTQHAHQHSPHYIITHNPGMLLLPPVCSGRPYALYTCVCADIFSHTQITHTHTHTHIRTHAHAHTHTHTHTI